MLQPLATDFIATDAAAAAGAGGATTASPPITKIPHAGGRVAGGGEWGNQNRNVKLVG